MPSRFVTALSANRCIKYGQRDIEKKFGTKEKKYATI
jgi:hypothetical protein